MNKLMMMIGGGMPRYMEAEGGAGGEGGGGTGGEGAGAQGGEGAQGGGAGGEGGQGNGGENGGAQGTPPPANGEGSQQTVPFLGGNGGEGDGKGDKGDDKGEPPKPATEEEYLKAVVKDEKLLGDDKTVQLDSNLVKALIPKAQELGVSPENMGKLANALAKAQIESAREQMKDRIAYFEKMKTESMQKYTAKDFETINAGIDKWFKPNGIMNNVIRNSELGADPEFLALMHHLGQAAKQDGLSGAGAGGGGSSANPDSTDGLSKLW